ncbi:transcriptional regulator YeiL [Cohnella caldifontis]|uniref:transcriptional regulator YeiL n=1 Tax=Cohnella caldifontis TaxID=3027471 RepID=UPI0023ED04AE|nr:transcriptional regulator YeiL [Cohnella sp. YIM B05605]
MHRIDDVNVLAECLSSSDFELNFSFPAARYARLFHAHAGDFILREGEEPAYLYYLHTGRVKLYLTLSNGKVSLIDFFEAPCFLGEMELIGVQRESRAIQALGDCRCLALPVRECRELLLHDALFLRKLCVYLGTKNNRNVASLSQNQAFPLANRLAAFLLFASPDGHYRERHTHAAEYLGVSYRHLLHTLSDFSRKGYIVKETRGYRLANRAALEEKARGIES